MTLKVIGAGFGRTGTTSLQAALAELGFDKCYHMREVAMNPPHARFWEQAVAESLADWDEIFQGYQSTVDWPGCTFYKELMERYPDAKVLLSIRDPERWYESTLSTIYRVPTSWMLFLLRSFLPHIRAMYRMINMQVWDGTFQSRFADREYAMTIFNQHNQDVIAHVPPERLLVYNVKEGWGPLCNFLEVEVPKNKPFPHLNDKLLMQRALRWGPVAILAAMGGVIAGLIWLVMNFIL